MPIEIRELTIKVVVGGSPAEQGSDQQRSVGGQPMPDKDQLIAECMEQLTTFLKDKEER